MKNRYLSHELLKYQLIKNLHEGVCYFRFDQFQIVFFRELMESLGDADTLEAQSKAILMENDIRDEEFTDEVKKTLI